MTHGIARAVILICGRVHPQGGGNECGQVREAKSGLAVEIQRSEYLWLFTWEFLLPCSELRMTWEGAVQPVLLIRCRLSGNKAFVECQYITHKYCCSSENTWMRDVGIPSLSSSPGGVRGQGHCIRRRVCVVPSRGEVPQAAREHWEKQKSLWGYMSGKVVGSQVVSLVQGSKHYP